MEKLRAVKKNKSLADKAYETIKNAIIYNKLKPGEILAEEKLAEELQISRTPVRSALSKLVYEEIAVINKSKNVIVSDITDKEINDIMIVRQKLEPLGVSLLKDNISKNDIEEIKNKYLKQYNMVLSDDSNTFIELDYEFHIKIAQCSKNRFLYDMIKKANLITKRFLILSGSTPKHSKAANEEHNEILTYIENGNFKYAEEAMKKHLINVKERMLII